MPGKPVYAAIRFWLSRPADFLQLNQFFDNSLTIQPNEKTPADPAARRRHDAVLMRLGGTAYPLAS
jgi:hypothetical protein